MSENPRRNREVTEQRLIAAVGDLILTQGFGAVGVNAIAEQAGVDKVLIYRYFGGLEGLLEAYGEQGDFWWRVDDLLLGLEEPGPNDLAHWLTTVFSRSLEFLRNHPVTLQILAWEMSERNALTASLEIVREQRSLDLMKALSARFGQNQKLVLRHVGPVMALLGAASQYLAIRSVGIKTFVGLDVQSDRGWQQIYQTIEVMIQGVLDSAPLDVVEGENP